ncbi:MAG: TonB family protein [Verrucomicrobiae bacterium]|nr:TonB family protein [Verrucomicrobiae bacterium]
MHLIQIKPGLFSRTAPYVGSLVFTAALFIALPFTQLISDISSFDQMDAGARILVAPPPSPPDIQPPEEKEPEEEDIKMDKEMQKISLSQINLALNAGAGGMTSASSLNVTSFELSDSFADDLVFEIAELDEAPEAVVRIAPTYPSRLKKEGVQGKVWILFIIDEHGVPSKPRVTESPHADLSEAALKAIIQWKFKPGRKDGKPVKTRVRIPLEFSFK